MSDSGIDTTPGTRLAARLRRLIENATPGPWRAYTPDDGHRPAMFVARNLGEIDEARPHWYVANIYAGNDRDANGELIAVAADPVFVYCLAGLLEAADECVDGIFATDEDGKRLEGLGHAITNLERAAGVLGPALDDVYASIGAMGDLDIGRQDNASSKRSSSRYLDNVLEELERRRAAQPEHVVEVLEISGDPTIGVVDVRLQPTGIDPNGPCTVAPDELGPDEVTERREAGLAERGIAVAEDGASAELVSDEADEYTAEQLELLRDIGKHAEQLAAGTARIVTDADGGNPRVELEP